MLPRLALLKAGRGLDTGAPVIEIDSGEVQVVLVESRFEARDFGTEPAGEILVGVNGDADLTLLDDSMNFNRAEGVGADTQMHLRVYLGIHLHIGWGIGRDGSGRWHGWRGRRGVEHLVSLRKRGRWIGCCLGRWHRCWWNGSVKRRRKISYGTERGRNTLRRDALRRNVMRWSDARLDRGGGFLVGAVYLERCCGSRLSGDSKLGVAGGIACGCGNRRGGVGIRSQVRRSEVRRSEVRSSQARSRRRDVVGGDVIGEVIGDGESGFWSSGRFCRCSGCIAGGIQGKGSGWGDVGSGGAGRRGWLRGGDIA